MNIDDIIKLKLGYIENRMRRKRLYEINEETIQKYIEN